MIRKLNMPINAPAVPDALAPGNTGTSPATGSSVRSWQIFLFGMVVSLAAMGLGAFNVGYSADDYEQMERVPASYFQNDYWVQLLVTEGRWGYVPFERLLYDFGIYPQTAPLVGALSLMAVFSAFGAWLCKFWRIEHQFVLCLFVTGLIAVHPYQVELYMYRSAAMYWAFCFIPGFAAVLLARMNWKSLVWTIPCMILSIASYQTILSYIGSAIAMGLLIEWARWMRAANPDERRVLFLVLRDRYLGAITTVVAAVAGYFVINKIILSFTRTSLEARSKFIHFGDLGEKVREIESFLKIILMRPEPIFPAGTKIALLLLLAWAFWIVLKTTFKNFKGGPKPHRMLAAAGGLPLLLLGILSILGILLPLHSPGLAPRLLAHGGVFWGGVLSLVWLDGGKLQRKIFVALGVVLLFSFCALCNRVLLDQLRVNQSDRMLANRIISRLEENPEFARVETLVTFGGTTVSKHSVRTHYSTLNASAFEMPWAQDDIIREACGRGFRWPNEKEKSIAEDYDRTAPRWPEPGSTTVIDHIAIVCLPR